MSTEIIHLQIQREILIIIIIRDFIGAIIKILYINKGMKQKAVQYFLIVFLALIVLGTILNIYKYKTLELMEGYDDYAITSTSANASTSTKEKFDILKQLKESTASEELKTYLESLIKGVEGNPETLGENWGVLEGKSPGVFNELYRIRSQRGNDLYSDQHFKDKKNELEKVMESYYKNIIGKDYFSLENKETQDILNFEAVDNEFIIYANYGLLKYYPKKLNVDIVYSYNEGEEGCYFNIHKNEDDIYSISPILDSTKVLHMKKDTESYLIVGEKNDKNTWKFKKTYSTDNPC